VYPYLRWLSVVLKRHDRRGIELLFEESRIRFHVWPGDLDFFGHMNNGRYLTLMDSGRFDLITRLGLLPHMKTNRMISVLGGATIQFKRPLRPFQRFDLLTRIVGWDAKWFYIEQRFESEGKLVANALVRRLFRAPGKSVPSKDVLALLSYDHESPPLPPHVVEWGRWQDESAVAPQPV
jgi:acyl-CoA thioesterase FadM